MGFIGFFCVLFHALYYDVSNELIIELGGCCDVS